MVNYIIYITVLLLVMGLFTILNRCNVEQKYRYRQIGNIRFILILSVVVFLVDIVFTYVLKSDIVKFFFRIINVPWLPMYSLRGILLISINLLILIVFLIYKTTFKFSFEKGIDKKKTSETNENRDIDLTDDFTERKHIGYKKIDKRVYLENDWVLIKKTLNILNIIAYLMLYMTLVIMILSIENGVYSTRDLEVPILDLITYISAYFRIAFFPILGILLINEVTAYLDGKILEEKREIEETEVEKIIKADKADDYRKLYDKYKEIWRNNLLASGAFESEKIEYADDYSDMNKNLLEVQKIHKQLSGEYKLPPLFYKILNDMFMKKDLLIQDANYEEIAPILFNFLENSIINGKKILILIEKTTYGNEEHREEVKQWFNSWFKRLYKKSLRNVATFDEWRDQKEWHIVIATQDEIIKFQEEFIGKIKEDQNELKDMVIVVMNDKTNEIAENVLSLSVLADILNAHFRLSDNAQEEKAQYVVFANSTANLQASINNNLGLQTILYPISNAESKNLYAMFWKNDVITPYYAALYDGTRDDMGTAATLSGLAWGENFSDINFAEHMNTPYKTYQQNVQGNKQYLRDRPIDKNKLSGVYQDKIHNNVLSSLIKKDENKLIFIEDSDNNLPLALRKFNSLGKENTFVNVISSSYLLRDYFIDNIKYFYRSPVHGYTPKIEVDKYKVATYLKETLTNNSLEIYEDEVRRELGKINDNLGNVQEELIKLFLDVYNIDIIRTGYLTVSVENIFNFEKNEFETKNLYKLDSNISKSNSLIWFENLEISDSSKKIHGIITYDHLYQNYLPGQVHAFNGNPYVIGKIDIVGRKMSIDAIGIQENETYRNKDNIKIELIKNVSSPKKETTSNFEIEKVLLNSSYAVETSGYYAFKDEIALKDNSYIFKNLSVSNHEFIREYENGRILGITISTKDKSKKIENYNKVSLTLTVLLNEIFKTIFPGNYKYMKIFTVLPNDYFNSDTEIDYLYTSYNTPENLAHIIPGEIKVSSEIRKEISINSENEIKLYFLEDTHRDVGILKTIDQNIKDIFLLIQDYISWINEMDYSVAQGNWNKEIWTKDKKMQFINYGNDELKENLDIESVKKFLDEFLGKNNPKTEARSRGMKTSDESKDEFDKEYEYLKEVVEKSK